MIWSVFKLSLRQWINRPWEVALAFLLPIVFFTIFALIFARGIQSQTSEPLSIAAIDDIQDEFSTELLKALLSRTDFSFVDLADSENPLQRARELIRLGDLKACLVIKKTLTVDGSQALGANAGTIEVLTDYSDQLAAGYVESATRETLMRLSLPESSGAQSGFSHTSENVGSAIEDPDDVGAFAVHQVEGNEVSLAPATRNSNSSKASTGDEVQHRISDVGVFEGTPEMHKHEWKTSSREAVPRLAITMVDILGDEKANPLISMYAAGIAVMFLLFNATSGSGVLIDERSNQTLDRLLSSHLTMDELLLGKWFFMTTLGASQVAVMFLWASVAFSLNLTEHIDGFFMMTIATSLAASGFGLFMATLCKTRAQLSGFSTVVVLTMSALGGSMVPRYLMSDSLKNLGLFTFNAWAIDGFDKVFWRELPVAALAPQLAVLSLSGVFFLSIARLLAIRWENG